MERAEVLIGKLRQQLKDGAPREQMILTLQLLQAEILGLPVATPSGNVSHTVSVIAPAGMIISPAAVSEQTGQTISENKVVAVLQVDEKELEAELQAMKEAADLRQDLSLKARLQVEQEASPIVTAGLKGVAPPPQEINERQAARSLSLNDWHTTANEQRSDQLLNEPLKDLRKAIGINDRYRFINELFAGDETGFEAAVKTLNGFSNVAEALFWLEKEGLAKADRKQDDPLVQQLVQLVRRRFA